MMGYGMIVIDEISPHLIGIVFEFSDSLGRYLKIKDEYPTQYIRMDSVNFISKDTYDILLSRNDVIKKWIEERNRE